MGTVQISFIIIIIIKEKTRNESSHLTATGVVGVINYGLPLLYSHTYLCAMAVFSIITSRTKKCVCVCVCVCVCCRRESKREKKCI